MSHGDDFRTDAYALLDQILKDASANPNREELLRQYADQFTLMHGYYAHKLLESLIADAHTRLDARLSPDPVRQTVASVQTTMQDIWKSIFGS
jgi:hypothetical protein